MVAIVERTGVSFDPTRDKTYRRAKLAADVVAWLTWEEMGGLSPRTLDTYERVLARLCLLYPHKTVDEITDADLLALAKRFHTAERRTRMAAVRKFFRFCKQTRRISDNPTDYLPMIRRPKQKVADVFTEAEVEALLSLDLIDAAPLAVLLDAGLRKAEARHLRKRDCIAENGVVVVRNGKGGRDRVVPMSKRLQVLMLDLEEIEKVQPHDFVFYAVRANEVSRRIMRNQPIGEGTFARWWRRCLEAADVRYRNPHIARHTMATSWRRRGLSIDELQILLGHASIATTADVYTHTNVDDVAEHMRIIEASEI